MTAINWWDSVQLSTGRPCRPAAILRQSAKAGKQAPAIAANLSERFAHQVTAAAVRKAAAARKITLKRGRPIT